jgi:RES domain-containing protein
VIVHRVIKARYASTPLSTDGARRLGGRWNSPGVPALYGADSLALAALEVFVHLQPNARHVHHVAVRLRLPERPGVSEWSASDLPPGWKTLEGNAQCRAQGDDWLRAAGGLALRVPSVIVPAECTVILNPSHPGWERVQVEAVHPFAFDPRLWKDAR